MKYFWIVIILIITGCSAHTKPIVKIAVPPEVALSKPKIKNIPRQNICLIVTNLSNEDLPHSSFKDFVKKHRVIEATFFAAKAWNLATNDHFIWKASEGDYCSETIYIILTRTNRVWKKLEQVYSADPYEVGFTLLSKKWIFIRPDVISGKYGFKGLVITLTHEMGHAIGLNHVDDSADIMNDSFSFKTINQMICLNGCVKVGKETLSNIKKVFDIDGKEVILF